MLGEVGCTVEHTQGLLRAAQLLKYLHQLHMIAPLCWPGINGGLSVPQGGFEVTGDELMVLAIGGL